MKNTTLPNSMIVSDLDGTIFNIRGEAPPNIKKLTSISKNTYFCVATARPPQDVSKLDMFKENNLTYSICLDGGLIVSIRNSTFKVLYEKLISIEKSIEVVKDILINRDINEFFIFTGEKNAFTIYHISKNINNDLHEMKIFQSQREIITVCIDDVLNLLPSLSIRAISLFTRDKITISSIEKMNLPSKLRMVTYNETRSETNHKWVDITSNKINKAHAIKKLCEYLNFSGKILALGNGENDIEMLKLSDISYVPSDAIPEILKIASYISNAECGMNFINEVVPFIKNELRANNG